jgi:hypothetical protein
MPARSKERNERTKEQTKNKQVKELPQGIFRQRYVQKSPMSNI